MENSKFILRLKKLLEENKISQKDLANKIETTEVSISRYMSGDREPKMYIVSKIADVLNVSVDYLLGKSEKKIDTSTVQHAFYSKYGTLPKEAQEDVDNYIEYLESKLKKK